MQDLSAEELAILISALTFCAGLVWLLDGE